MDLSDISVHATRSGFLAQRSVTWSSDIGAVCGGLYFSSMKFVFTFFLKLLPNDHGYMYILILLYGFNWSVGL